MSYFVLADCNNFYVSCERLFNPKLENRPVLVLSSNDGCVVARSQEVKQLGIKMGTPYFQIKDFCHSNKVAIYSSNFELYGDLSQRVMSLLAADTMEMSVYSIDEAFLQYPLEMSPEEVFLRCATLRSKVKKWTGIPISLGIAPTMTLAKMANSMAKKDAKTGVFSLMAPEVRKEVMATYHVEDVWGIGPAWRAKLHEMGIWTALQFAEMDPTVVRGRMGVVGERMLWELRGASCFVFDEEPASKKSITCSRSFGQSITSLPELAEALSCFVNSAAAKLRDQGSYASALCVYTQATANAKEGTRRHYSMTLSLPTPTNYVPHLIQAAKKCLTKLFVEKERYKKCGVILLDLVAEDQLMPDLFIDPLDPKRRQLMGMIDEVNARHGKDTLFFGAMGTNRKERTRCNSRSPHFTTQWNELATAKAI